METIPVEQDQDVATESSQLSSDDLGTRAILREIMKHFSNNDLLNLSLVSKFWKSEARSLLSDQGALTAKVQPSSRFNQRSLPKILSALASDLRAMNAAPKSLCGISLELNHNSATREPSSIMEEADLNEILKQLQWRSFVVRFSQVWNPCHLCQEVSSLMKRILEEKSDELVEISMDIDVKLAKFLRDIKLGSLSRLKTLQVRLAFDVPSEIDWESVRLLVSRAPMLQKLFCDSIATENVLEGSSAVLVPTPELDPCKDFSKDILNSIRLERIKLITEDLNMERFKRNMPVLLQNSQNTLKSLHINFIAAVLLMQYGICLRNVTKLEIDMDTRSIKYFGTKELLAFLTKVLDFTRVFPKLAELRISVDVGHNEFGLWSQISQIAEEGQATLAEHVPDGAMKIKHIFLSLQGYLHNCAIQFFAATFKNVGQLTVETASEEDIYQIREHWVDLKKIVWVQPPPVEYDSDSDYSDNEGYLSDCYSDEYY